MRRDQRRRGPRRRQQGADEGLLRYLCGEQFPPGEMPDKAITFVHFAGPAEQRETWLGIRDEVLARRARAGVDEFPDAAAIDRHLEWLGLNGHP